MNDSIKFSERLKNSLEAGKIIIDPQSKIVTIIIEPTHNLSQDIITSAADFANKSEDLLKLRAELKNLGYAAISANEWFLFHRLTNSRIN